MPDPTADASRSAEPLYAWWLNLLPTFLGAGASPAADAPPAPAAGGPEPLGAVSQALASAQQGLGKLYADMLGAMVANPQGGAMEAFRRTIQGRLDGLGQLYAKTGQAFSTQQDMAAQFARWVQAPTTLFADALAPVSSNLERAYGGLADAFGLAPTRELQEAARDMAAAAVARRQAQAEYLAIVGAALATGAERLTARLGEMAQRGESVDTLLGLVRLWARTTDEAVHQAMQDPKALQASAKLIRAATNARHQQQRVVAIASRALNVPTRAEVDDAYREIQELKRELRRLRKRLEPVSIEPASAGRNGASRAPARGARAGSRKAVAA